MRASPAHTKPAMINGRASVVVSEVEKAGAKEYSNIPIRISRSAPT